MGIFLATRNNYYAIVMQALLTENLEITKFCMLTSITSTE
jgi:hypothetical protein